MKNNSFHLLTIGVSWPMETFLNGLFRGLAAKGVRITLASEIRPDQTWLNETGIEWMLAPLWRGVNIALITRLFFQSLRIITVAHKDGDIFWRAALSRTRWRDRFSYWDALAPFAGRRWDAIYFPWIYSAVHYLPLFELGIPVVVSCRGSQINVASFNPRRAGILSGLRETFAKAATIHCVSQDILQQALPLGLDTAKARVIHPAVDAEFFRPNGLSYSSDGVFRVVTIGSLVWVKGFEYALLAIQLLKEQGIPVSFEVIGDGVELSRMLFTIDDLGLQDCVQLSGRLSPEQVRERLQQADAFMLSSLSEGISNAALEAMACGLAVVSTDCGGMREAITDGVDGFIVPVRDPQALAEKLAVLAKNPDLRWQMGLAGRERILREFQVHDQLCQWLDVFNDVVGHS